MIERVSQVVFANSTPDLKLLGHGEGRAFKGGKIKDTKEEASGIQGGFLFPFLHCDCHFYCRRFCSCCYCSSCRCCSSCCCHQ